MLTYKATFASVNVADCDVQRAVNRIESIHGVKVLDASTKFILVQFDADVKHLAANPMLQRNFDILRGDVRAEIEKACGITIKDCASIQLTPVKKLILFLKRLF